VNSAATMPDAGMASWLGRARTEPDPELLAMVTGGPCDPDRVLDMADMDRLLDPAPLEVETGWCHMPDGSGFVAARVEMPDVTAEMVDWWFDWHPRRPGRYEAWHPEAHVSAKLLVGPEGQAKPFWGAVHEVREDVGTGEVKARIEFLPPSQVGFSTDALDDPRVGTIVCGRVGDRLMRHTVMCHVWLREGDGLVLRSHFWLGGAIEPRLPGALSPLGRALGRPLNSRSVRRFALPGRLPASLARHCVEEYTNLAVILPPLSHEFANKEAE